MVPGLTMNAKLPPPGDGLVVASPSSSLSLDTTAVCVSLLASDLPAAQVADISAYQGIDAAARLFHDAQLYMSAAALTNGTTSFCYTS
jgi:hypothetical protein